MCGSLTTCVAAVLVSVEIVINSWILKQLDLHQVSNELHTLFGCKSHRIILSGLLWLFTIMCQKASLGNSRGIEKAGMWFVTIKRAVTVVGIATHKPIHRISMIILFAVRMLHKLRIFPIIQRLVTLLSDSDSSLISHGGSQSWFLKSFMFG